LGICPPGPGSATQFFFFFKIRFFFRPQLFSFKDLRHGSTIWEFFDKNAFYELYARNAPGFLDPLEHASIPFNPLGGILLTTQSRHPGTVMRHLFPDWQLLDLDLAKLQAPFLGAELNHDRAGHREDGPLSAFEFLIGIKGPLGDQIQDDPFVGIELPENKCNQTNVEVAYPTNKRL
jgi:hypothetical protein